MHPDRELEEGGTEDVHMSDPECPKDVQRLRSLEWAKDEAGEDFLTLPAHLVPTIIRRGKSGVVIRNGQSNERGHSARTSTRRLGDPV